MDDMPEDLADFLVESLLKAEALKIPKRKSQGWQVLKPSLAESVLDDPTTQFTKDYADAQPYHSDMSLYSIDGKLVNLALREINKEEGEIVPSEDETTAASPKREEETHYERRSNFRRRPRVETYKYGLHGRRSTGRNTHRTKGSHRNEAPGRRHPENDKNFKSTAQPVSKVEPSRRIDREKIKDTKSRGPEMTRNPKKEDPKDTRKHHVEREPVERDHRLPVDPNHCQQIHVAFSRWKLFSSPDRSKSRAARVVSPKPVAKVEDPKSARETKKAQPSKKPKEEEQQRSARNQSSHACRKRNGPRSRSPRRDDKKTASKDHSSSGRRKPKEPRMQHHEEEAERVVCRTLSRHEHWWALRDKQKTFLKPETEPIKEKIEAETDKRVEQVVNKVYSNSEKVGNVSRERKANTAMEENSNAVKGGVKVSAESKKRKKNLQDEQKDIEKDEKSKEGKTMHFGESHKRPRYAPHKDALCHMDTSAVFKEMDLALDIF